MFETKDSGKRAEYDSGMVRDTEEGKARFDLILPAGVPYAGQMLTRFAELMERGARKYTERNWERARGLEELARYRSSALRHLIQWMTGETDEDHAAAVMFNVLAGETVSWKRLNLPKQVERVVPQDGGNAAWAYPHPEATPVDSRSPSVWHPTDSVLGSWWHYHMDGSKWSHPTRNCPYNGGADKRPAPVVNSPDSQNFLGAISEKPEVEKGEAPFYVDPLTVRCRTPGCSHGLGCDDNCHRDIPKSMKPGEWRAYTERYNRAQWRQPAMLAKPKKGDYVTCSVNSTPHRFYPDDPCQNPQLWEAC